MNKYIIITVDTEGDDLWHYRDGGIITTNNASYIPRFQSLCEEFGFKPVYLTNYEMITSSDFVNYIRPKAIQQLCEVGIHIHAWNNPPGYQLDKKYNGNPYLIEYPREIMREKFKITYDLITEQIGVKPVSHRAGRWTMNKDYFRLLEDFNIAIDCSITPGISWATNPGATISGGSDYSNEIHYPFFVGKVLEVPVTIKKEHRFFGNSLRSKARNLIKGETLWFRPANQSFEEMFHLLKEIEHNSDSDYIQMMIHSSELMPGGSPYFVSQEAIEGLYCTLVKLFSAFKKFNYTGITLKDYYNRHYESLI